MTASSLDLRDGLRLSGMTYAQLWIRYFELGGTGTLDQMREHLEREECPDRHEHNIIAQALNDSFVDQGQDHPVAYSHLYQHDGSQ
jgi:hypothetical protein